MPETQRGSAQQPGADDHELHDPDDELVDKAKDELADLVDAPGGADYEEGKTNPVTGQRRGQLPTTG